MNPVRAAARDNTFAAMLALGLLLLTAPPMRADDITLVETGSSLLYPPFNIWASEYMKTHRVLIKAWKTCPFLSLEDGI